MPAPSGSGEGSSTLRPPRTGDGAGAGSSLLLGRGDGDGARLDGVARDVVAQAVARDPDRPVAAGALDGDQLTRSDVATDAPARDPQIVGYLSDGHELHATPPATSCNVMCGQHTNSRGIALQLVS